MPKSETVKEFPTFEIISWTNVDNTLEAQRAPSMKLSGEHCAKFNFLLDFLYGRDIFACWEPDDMTLFYDIYKLAVNYEVLALATAGQHVLQDYLSTLDQADRLYDFYDALSWIYQDASMLDLRPVIVNGIMTNLHVFRKMDGFFERLDNKLEGDLMKAWWNEAQEGN
ncbi:hypothetical protein MMC25_001385 [Agyrium rufum]|nr:hypothetical protein [Agyrium rufum]